MISTNLLFRMRNCIPILFILVSCQKQDFKGIDSAAMKSKVANAKGLVSNEMVLHWNENTMKVIAVTPAPPPILSRYATMTQVAVHDALNAIKPKYKSYALVGYRDKDADEQAAVISAAYWTMKSIDAYLKTLGPTGLPLQSAGNNWDGWYAASLQSIADGEAKTKGIELGKMAAQAMMDKRANDGFVTARIVYVPTTPPVTPPPAGTWRPTISAPPVPAYHIGGLPNWPAHMKSFSGMEANAFRSAPPPDLNSTDYTNDFNEVKNLGARVNSTRTPDQSQIANFWQEGPTQILNRMVRLAIMNKQMDAWRSARLLAMCNVSIFDSFLGVFDGLYYYYRWRPETAIRLAANDGNDNTTPDAGWLPFVTDIKLGTPPQTPTPPIPDYPNPNAAIGQATANVLQYFFNTDNTNISIPSLDVLSAGQVRSYTSFQAAVNDFAMSRIYAGFNFRHSINAGMQLGSQVAAYVVSNMFGENE
jgi:hypothetical protein